MPEGEPVRSIGELELTSSAPLSRSVLADGRSHHDMLAYLADIGDLLHTMFPSEGVLLVKDLLPRTST